MSKKDSLNNIKLPSNDNAIVIMWEDGFKNIQIHTTPYLTDMLKSLGEDNELLITKETNEWKLSVAISMEKLT